MASLCSHRAGESAENISHVGRKKALALNQATAGDQSPVTGVQRSTSLMYSYAAKAAAA